MTERRRGRTDLLPKRNTRLTSIPEDGWDVSDAFREIGIAARRTPCDYESGEPFAKPGTKVDLIAAKAAEYMMHHMNPNIVDPHMFLGAYELEREALAMTGRLLGKPDDSALADGFFLGGGTESMVQAMWTYRNAALAKHGLNVDALGLASALNASHTIPIILAPLDVHFAAHKSAAALGLGRDNVVTYGLRSDYTTDFTSLEKTVRDIYARGARTSREGLRPELFMNICVAGDTQKGLIQDVAAITGLIDDLAREYGVEPPATVVDAAAQYLFAGVMRDSPLYRKALPLWDFRVPAVRAIVADAHKNEVPYNAGMLLLRSMEDARFTDSDGMYLHKNLLTLAHDMSTEEREAAQHNATLPTSRGGYGAAATWAYYAVHGLQGIRSRKEDVWSVVQFIADGIRQSRHFTLLAEPQTAIVPFVLTGDQSAQRYTRIYQAINDSPDDNLYLSKSSTLRARTHEDLRLSRSMGEESVFTGLYAHVMEHNTVETASLLLRRLDEEARRA